MATECKNGKGEKVDWAREEDAEAVISHPKGRNTPNICSIDLQGFDTTSEMHVGK